MKTRVLIDTDPGIDDAMAVHLAFAHPALEVVALTSVFGNVHVPVATRNALRLAELAGASVPVAEGEAAPLAQPLRPPGYFVHGNDGFGTVPAAEPAGSPDPRDAAQCIVDLVAASQGEVTLCPVGPLTNVARALERSPAIRERVREVVVMGGAVRCPGNASPWAEANIWSDPHAAARVFAADWPVTLVGLDVTERVRCTPEDFAGLAEASPVIGGFLNEAVQFYFGWHRKKHGLDGCFMHDPAAVLAVAEPGFFEFEDVPLRVELEGPEIGRTVEDPDAGTRPVRVCVGVDAEGVRERILSLLANADRCRSARLA